jgi:hypothetical protein
MPKVPTITALFEVVEFVAKQWQEITPVFGHKSSANATITPAPSNASMSFCDCGKTQNVTGRTDGGDAKGADPWKISAEA